MADLFYVASLPETHLLYNPAELTALVRDFDRDSVYNRKRINEILQDQPEVFYRLAVEVLKQDTESRAAQYLVSLLASGKLIFRALCDPQLDREHAMALARQAMRIDPLVDTSLARQLADAAANASGAVETGMGERLLDILDQISDGKRLLSSLMRILRHDNPYLRSKAVLMIGKGGRNVTWLKRRLEEADTRVRANAIEAMWGLDTPEARELLVWAARDSNNRVVGNALLGLYNLGVTGSLAELVKMAGHQFPAFRRTAAWAMGETGDPRFSEVLGRMIAETNADVRKSAFAAVGRIRSAIAQVAQAPEWAVAASGSPKNLRTGQRSLSVAVSGADGRDLPKVLPVQFMLSENGQPVWLYRVVEKPPADPMSVVFLFPRKTDNAVTPWDRGTQNCLPWKRSTDLWSAVPYFGVDDRPSGSAEFQLPAFIANASQAARVFEQPTLRADCSGFWTALRGAVETGNTAFRGRRYVIVLAPVELGAPSDDKLVSAVYGSRTSIHVVATVGNRGLQALCQRVDGRFHRVNEEADVEDRIARVYLSLLARYEIRYVPASDAPAVKLRVHSPAGWGETVVHLPE